MLTKTAEITRDFEVVEGRCAPPLCFSFCSRPPQSPSCAASRRRRRAANSRHLQAMYVELNGKPVQPSAGAQIRDADNRLVLPTSLVEKFDVRYQLDGAGLVHRVWILMPLEREQALPLPEQPVTLPDAKS